MGGPMKTESADLLIGKVLGGAYKVGRLIGRGGMGSVYEASHVRLPKRYAVKLLQRSLTDDKEAFARFQREAEIASSIGNRHIAEVVDFNFLPNGVPYMVMEYLEGEDLATRLRRVHRLPPRAALDLCGQVAAGLSAAHKRGVVHRDLKPENIFLCPTDEGDDFIKLLDFGISKIRGAQKTMTGDMMMLGTPAYMSPEQARGDVRRIDQRTDVYALGAVMYEVLTGRPAFEGENVYATLMKIANEMPEPIHEVVPEVPPALDDVVRQALTKEPSGRQPSATDFWKALKAAFESPFEAYSTVQQPIPSVREDTIPELPPVMEPQVAADAAGAAAQRETPPKPQEKVPRPLSTPAPLEPLQSMDSAPTLVADPDLGELNTTSQRSRRLPEPASVGADALGPGVVIPRQVAVAIGAAVGTLLVLGLYLALRSHPQPQPVATIDPTPVAPALTTPPVDPLPVPPAEPAPEMVHVRLTVTPADAHLELDGRPVSGSPLLLPRSSETHLLVVTADGYRRRQVPIVASADRSLRIDLVRASRPPAALPSPPAPAPASKKPPPSSLIGGSDL